MRKPKFEKEQKAARQIYLAGEDKSNMHLWIVARLRQLYFQDWKLGGSDARDVRLRKAGDTFQRSLQLCMEL